MRLIVPVLAILVLFLGGAADAAGAQRGRAYARAHCARCHAIDRTSKSRMRSAPPLRTLHARYPIEGLEEALAEGMVTGHPTMPEIRLSPDRIGDFIAYLKSLER